MLSFVYAEEVFFLPTRNLTPLINSLVFEQIRKEVKLAWFSSGSFLISHVTANQSF